VRNVDVIKPSHSMLKGRSNSCISMYLCYWCRYFGAAHARKLWPRRRVGAELSEAGACGRAEITFQGLGFHASNLPQDPVNIFEAQRAIGTHARPLAQALLQPLSGSRCSTSAWSSCELRGLCSPFRPRCVSITSRAVIMPLLSAGGQSAHQPPGHLRAEGQPLPVRLYLKPWWLCESFTASSGLTDWRAPRVWCAPCCACLQAGVLQPQRVRRS